MAASERTFFHCCPAEADPASLLDPDRQVTEPWGEPKHGTCDKCGGRGSTPYECFSCLEAGSDPECPACQGRVRFEQTCPTCQGSGEIHRTRRRGIAVFPRREGLYRYLAWKNDSEPNGKVVVELAGRLSDDCDLDADHGALLVLPERVVAVEPLDADAVAAISDRIGEEVSQAPGRPDQPSRSGDSLGSR